MTDLEKLLRDKQDALRGRPRDWIDDFKDWRQRADWGGFAIFVVLMLTMWLLFMEISK